MSTKNTLIFIFWAFVLSMLGYQMVQEYLKGQAAHASYVARQVVTPPQATSPAATLSSTPPPPISPDADVRQIGYSVKGHSPTQFEAIITLKNVGGGTAAGVQIFVRPFRGGDNSKNPGMDSTTPEDSPDSQYGEWVSFPDLAPGQEATQPFDFNARPEHGISPGGNDDPKIIWVTKKN